MIVSIAGQKQAKTARGADLSLGPFVCIRPPSTATTTVCLGTYVSSDGRSVTERGLSTARKATPWSTQLRRRLAWPPTSPFCWHQPSASAAC